MCQCYSYWYIQIEISLRCLPSFILEFAEYGPYWPGEWFILSPILPLISSADPCRQTIITSGNDSVRLFPVAPCTVPSLSGMKMPVTEMIQETINRLLSMLDGGELSKRLKPDRARVGGGGAILGW